MRTRTALRSRFLPVLAGLSAIVGLGQRSTASVICGVSYTGVFAIDPDAGLVTPLLAFPPNLSCGNISAGPAAGTLYLTESNLSVPNSNHLYRYVPGGALEFVGGNVPGNSLGEGRDGFLYYGDRDFGRADPASGQATSLASTPTFGGDIATSLSGETFGTFADHSFVRLDRTTGQFTILGLFPVQMYGLSFTLDGRMWGADADGNFYQINPVTLSLTFRFNFGAGAPLDLASEPIPAPGILAPFALSTILGARRSPRRPARA